MASVGRDASAEVFEIRDDVAPQYRRVGVPCRTRSLPPAPRSWDAIRLPGRTVLLVDGAALSFIPATTHSRGSSSASKSAAVSQRCRRDD